jgi:uncharacterized damage-inducible protein DinB
VTLPFRESIEARFGRCAPTTLEETALQVVFHTTHHRGQICARLRELGGEPPTPDFLAWVWLGRPQAAWPEGR